MALSLVAPPDFIQQMPPCPWNCRASYSVSKEGIDDLEMYAYNINMYSMCFKAISRHLNIGPYEMGTLRIIHAHWPAEAACAWLVFEVPTRKGAMVRPWKVDLVNPWNGQKSTDTSRTIEGNCLDRWNGSRFEPAGTTLFKNPLGLIFFMIWRYKQHVLWLYGLYGNISQPTLILWQNRYSQNISLELPLYLEKSKCKMCTFG